MKTLKRMAVTATLAVAAAAGWLAPAAVAGELKPFAIPEAHLAAYGRRNPERDGERLLAAEAWKTFADEKIVERFIAIVADAMPKDKLDQAKAFGDEVRAALAPINCEALANATEGVYVQKFETPFNHHALAVRLAGSDAESSERGLVQLMTLLVGKTDGKVTMESIQVGQAKLTVVRLPKESPFQPCVARLDDVLAISSSDALLRKCLERMQTPGATSKFDDPRYQEAFAALPPAEDAVSIFDGRQMFDAMRGLPEFIRQQSHQDPKALKVASLIERVFNEVDFTEFVASVETTDPGRHGCYQYGKLNAGYQEKLLGKVVAKGQPFEDWQSWVPADAEAYSMSQGVDLHELYVGVRKLIEEEFPESAEGWTKFDQKQTEVGVNLDADVLQAFPGATVSVTVPLADSQGAAKPCSVCAVRCNDPDGVAKLIARAVEGLKKIPAVQAQQLDVVPCEGLEGFQELKAGIFAVVGARPVFGFRDGWMICSSRREAVEKVLAVRAGQGESIDHAASFEKFHLKHTGPLYAVSYGDTGAAVRHAADALDQAGAVAPMVLGMIGAQAKPEEIKPLVDLMGLLPSVAKVVRKFDYYDARMSMTYAGPTPDAFIVECVQLVKTTKTP